MNIKTLNKKELIKLCEEKAIEIDDEMTKDDLIELLESQAEVEDKVVDNVIVHETSRPYNKTQETVKIIRTGSCRISIYNDLFVRQGDVMKVDNATAGVLKRRGFAV